MDAFITHTGRAVPLRRSNVDTDQIIPASYLKRVTRSGFEDGLFAAWRSDPDFVLNQPQWAGVSILLAGRTSVRERELALRGGVNLVMYTLTGNYKADQVHVHDLLERLAR